MGRDQEIEVLKNKVPGQNDSREVARECCEVLRSLMDGGVAFYNDILTSCLEVGIVVYVRMNAMNKEILKYDFDLLDTVLEENNLKIHPEQIYDMDETGLPLNPLPPQVEVTRKFDINASPSLCISLLHTSHCTCRFHYVNFLLSSLCVCFCTCPFLSSESFQLISSIASGSNPPSLDEAAPHKVSADEDCECAFCYACYCQDGKSGSDVPAVFMNSV